MPKVKPIKSAILKNYVSEFGDAIFSSDGSILFCKMCEVQVCADRRYIVTQHLKTDKHSRAVNKKNNTKSQVQQLVTNTKKSNFSFDLCKALMSSNIPLHKISNIHFRSFLEKYTGKEIPTVTTLRKTYVNDCYDDTMKIIRNYVTGKKIWVSIDETTDKSGRFIANVVIGTLEFDQPGKIFLLTTEILEKANHSTIAKLFDKSMFILWPNGIRHDDVLLFLSDAAPYMVKAASTIKVLYSKIVHITCLAHGIHRVAETIRSNFPKIDKLIAKVKQIFLKAPNRILLFKEEAPGINLPPQPIITRWGTWINAASYYCEHFVEVKKVIQLLNSNDAISIEQAQHLLSDSSMETNLAFIHSNYGFIPAEITKLETQHVPLIEALSIVKNVETKIEKITGQNGILINQKFKTILQKNEGYQIIFRISKILSGEIQSMEGLPEDLTNNDLIYFKYAPITTTDVERSFSRYKNLLCDNRRSFDFENLKKSFVVQCNNVSNIHI